MRRVWKNPEITAFWGEPLADHLCCHREVVFGETKATNYAGLQVVFE
jgi:hypothetical protein